MSSIVFTNFTSERHEAEERCSFSFRNHVIRILRLLSRNLDSFASLRSTSALDDQLASKVRVGEHRLDVESLEARHIQGWLDIEASKAA